MPPRKKGRVLPGAPPIPSGDETEHTVLELPISVEANAVMDKMVSNPWTDEQETSLFRAMVRWKPVGSFSHYVGEGG